MAWLKEHDGGFQVCWRDPDGRGRSRRRGFSFKNQSRREAKKRADQFLVEVRHLEEEGSVWVHPRHVRIPRLIDALELYLSDYARPRSANSVRAEALRLRQFRTWAESIVDEPTLQILTRDHVVQFHQHLATSPTVAGKYLLEGKRRSTTTLEKYIRTVERFWRWCWERDDLTEYVTAPRGRLELPTAIMEPTRAPTWAEMDACVEECRDKRKKKDPRSWQWRCAVVMRFTGLRVSQVMGLYWSELDLEEAVLYFPGRLGKTAFERQGRVIPVSTHLVAELATWGTREGWLIESGRKPGPREREFRSRDMVRAWTRAGIRPEVWRKRPDHAFRKGFTSELKRAGADPEAAEFLVGRKLGGERGTYIDPAALPLREAVDLIPPLGGSGVVQLKKVRK